MPSLLPILKDDLTGLYNRRGFFTLAEQGLKTAQRMGTEMLLIYGDLDNLKGIRVLMIPSAIKKVIKPW